MGPLIVADITLLAFCIYIGIFLRNFHSSYPEMEVGFHVWEVCYSKETWEYGNKLAGRLSIILGLILFGIIYPILLYFFDNRNYLSIMISIFVLLFIILLFGIVKLWIRKKFKLK
ncbi:MAG: SdpI family protein [Anaerococcus sp.]|nr:SdpI family protein [Anaerococcus sp.]